MTDAAQIAYDARPLYRVHRDLAYKEQVVARGSLHRLDRIAPAGIERLIERGVISVAQAPPLVVLPGWTRRAERLAPLGITDAVQFLGAHEGQAAERLGIKAETVQRWKMEVAGWLAPPEGARR